MRLTTAGTPHLIQEAVVGRITTTPVETPVDHVLVAHSLPFNIDGYRAILTPEKLQPQNLVHLSTPVVHSLRDHEHWRDSDIVILEPGGFVRTIYRPDSAHNTIFVTERCNSNCLMCSQPPKDHDDTDHFLAVNLELLRLVDPGLPMSGLLAANQRC